MPVNVIMPAASAPKICSAAAARSGGCRQSRSARRAPAAPSASATAATFAASTGTHIAEPSRMRSRNRRLAARGCWLMRVVAPPGSWHDRHLRRGEPRAGRASFRPDPPHPQPERAGRRASTARRRRPARRRWTRASARRPRATRRDGQHERQLRGGEEGERHAVLRRSGARRGRAAAPAFRARRGTARRTTPSFSDAGRAGEQGVDVERHAADDEEERDEHAERDRGQLRVERTAPPAS